MTERIEPESESSTSGPDTGTEAPPARLRLWPAVLIVAAHVVVTLAVWRFGSTNEHSAIGFIAAPLLATALLCLWWLFASRAPWRARLLGFALFVAATAGIVLLQPAHGVMMLMFALPALTIGVVILLVLISGASGKVQGRVAAVWMLACAVLFSLLRVDSVGGDLTPVLAWRWTPPTEEGLLPEMEATGDRHGVAADLPLEPAPEDWPAFRGPARDGSRGAGGVRIATDWAASPPREVWRRRVGAGWSSFAAVGDYLFTQEQRGPKEYVACYRADTGDEVWARGIAAHFTSNTGGGPRATPTYHRQRLYTLGATGVLQCLDASTGDTIWKRSLTEDTGARIPTWGFASSPLVADGLVIVFAEAGGGKAVAAYSAETGEPAWTAGDGTHGYSSVHYAELGGAPQLLQCSDRGLASFSPADGRLLWEHAWKTKSNPRCVQPLLVGGDAVLIGTPGGQGTRRLRVRHAEGAWTVEEEWTTRSLRPYFNDSVYHKGYCYGFDGNRLTCIDAATGKRLWSGERYGGQVLLLPEMDMLLLLSEAGEVVLIPATPEEPMEVARFQALHGKTWNHPVLVRGRLYVRNAEEAACFALEEAAPGNGE
jgi:outer membrane protein assembly factor BamB